MPSVQFYVRNGTDAEVDAAEFLRSLPMDHPKMICWHVVYGMRSELHKLQQEIAVFKPRRVDFFLPTGAHFPHPFSTPHPTGSRSRSYTHYRAANTSSAWPSGFTLLKIFAILPFSMTNVVRATPITVLPYMFFSFITPYLFAISFSASARR